MDPNRLTFAEKMLAAVRQTGHPGPFAFDEERFAIRVGPSGVFFLENAFVEWTGTSRLRRGGVVKRLAAFALEFGDALPATLDEARPNLRVRVRDLDWFGITALLVDDPAAGAAVSFRPLNDDLALELVYDTPGATRSIDGDDLARWGVELDDALKIGRANLRHATDGTFERDGEGVYVAPWQDSYGASRLVLAELVGQLDVEGDPVALLPTRDHLFVTGSDDSEGLAEIARRAAPLLDEPRRLTGIAFARRGEQWERFLPPEGHRARTAFVELSLLSDAAAYEDQRQVLQPRDEDVYVAKLLLFRAEDDALVSVATWVADNPTLLPRATHVSLVEPSRGAAHVVPWDALVAEWGHQMEAAGLRPERWAVRQHPPADVVARITKRELGSA